MGLLLLSGCNTKKNTLTRRMFHNLTSHYNVYWNGEKSLQDGDRQLRDRVKDDYTKVLPVNNYGTQQDGTSLNSSMDRALEKTAICVQKHSMKFGNRERVKWIDDAYLVMGKAHFYKHDYLPAARTFDFVANEYHYNDISYVANMWLIKTYLAKPLSKIGRAVGLSSDATAGLLAASANVLAALAMVKDLKARDKVIVISFSVCCAFLFGDHLSFTANFQPTLIVPVLLGKLAGGVCAIFFATRLAIRKAEELEAHDLATGELEG